MKTIETLRTENNELLTLSENLLKQFRKMMRVGNVNGAKLIYNRAEEVNAQRQSNIALILAM
jgi:hypothetical protein